MGSKWGVVTLDWRWVATASAVGAGTLAIFTLFKPPKEFPNRLEAIEPEKTTIDNEYYGELHDLWWQSGGGPTAGLHVINPVRKSYFVKRIMDHFPGIPRENLRGLDVGCGGGILTEALAQDGFILKGVDISKPSLEAAYRHAEKMGLGSKLEYVVGSAYELPVPDHSVDFVVMSDLLEHLHDIPRALKEVNRVLRPGGVYVFDTINRNWISYILTIRLAQMPFFGVIIAHTHDYRLYITPHEMQVALENTGLVSDALLTFRGIALKFSLLKFLRSFSFWGSIRADEVLSLRLSYMGAASKPN